MTRLIAAAAFLAIFSIVSTQAAPSSEDKKGIPLPHPVPLPHLPPPHAVLGALGALAALPAFTLNEKSLSTLSTRDTAGCQLAVQRIGTSINTIITQFVTLQTVGADFATQAFGCLGSSGGQATSIGPCIQNVATTEVTKIQTAVQTIVSQFTSLGTAIPQLLQQCLGSLPTVGAS